MKILLLISLISLETNACIISESYLDRSQEFPESARTIVLGKIVRKRSQTFFVSKKLWKSLNVEISTEECGGFAISGDTREVLLTSKKSIQALTGRVMDVGNSDVTNITRIDSFAEKFGKLKEEFPEGEANVFWKYCSDDSSCVKMKSFCGSSVGINKQFQANYENYLNSNQSKFKCDKKIEKRSKASRCIKNFCN